MKTIIIIAAIVAMATSAFAQSTIGFGVHPNLAYLNVSGCTGNEFRGQGRAIAATNTAGKVDIVQSSAPDPLIYQMLGLPSAWAGNGSTIIPMAGLAYFEFTNGGSSSCIYRLMGDAVKSHWSAFVVQ